MENAVSGDVAMPLSCTDNLNTVQCFMVQLENSLHKAGNTTEAIQLAREINDTIIETIPAGIAIANAQGQFVFCNATAKKVFKFGLSGSVYNPAGYKIFKLDGTPLPVEESPLVRALRRGRKVERIELLVRHDDGGEHILLESSSPLQDQKGDIFGAIAVFYDITGQKQLEQELAKYRESLEKLVWQRTQDLMTTNQQLKKEASIRKEITRALFESEKKFRSLFNSIADIIILHEISHEGIGHFIEVNDAACSRLGYSREELLQMKMSDIEYSYDSAKTSSFYKKITELPLHKTFETTLVGKSGEKIDVEINSHIFIWNDQKVSLAVARDITQRKAMEKEMARLDRLGLVGEMSAGIAHEIRNPMTAVRGFLQLLRNKKELTAYDEYFNIMLTELDRANSIINEVLTMAKNKPTDYQKSNLNHIIGMLLPLIEANAVSSNNIEVKTVLQQVPDLLLDEKEIKQLILNLVRNGLEAMSSGGILTIETFSGENDVTLVIKDTGHGIEPEILKKIGTPFVTTKESGTGLGLAICYSIAARHQAVIDIDTSSQGTSIKVRFPTPV